MNLNETGGNYPFDGSQLTAIIKTHFLSKKEIPDNDLDIVVTKFLASYFESSKFYKYDEFKSFLIENLERSISSGLEHDIGEKFRGVLNKIILNSLTNFRKIHKVKVFDGLTWRNDLKPVIKKIIFSIFDNLTNLSELEPLQILLNSSIPELSEKFDETGIDFNAIFDINLSIDTFQETMEKLLNGTDLSDQKKNTLLRSKVHEFFMQKRKSLHDQ